LFDPSPAETISASPVNLIALVCAQECSHRVRAPKRLLADGLRVRRRHSNDEDTAGVYFLETNLAVQGNNAGRNFACLHTARSLYILLQGRNRRRLAGETGFMHTDEPSKGLAIGATQ
jgi:hypothetical protein